jgi:hypothetical protein
MKAVIRICVFILAVTLFAVPAACNGAPPEITTPAAPTPTITPTPEPDFNTIEADLLGSTVSFNIGANNAIWEDVVATSPDGTITVGMNWGTKLSDADGKAITILSAALNDAPAQPEDGKLLGPTVTFLPDATVIDPGISIEVDTTGYLDQLGDVPEEDLCVALFDAASGNWTRLSSIANPTDHTVTATIYEFTVNSTIGLLARQKPVVVSDEPPQAIPMEWLSIIPPTSYPGDEITVVIKTTPGATCVLTFINPPYNPDKPRTRSAKKPAAQTADENGMVTFTWNTSTHSHAGDADLEIVLTLGEDTAIYMHPYVLKG